MERLEVLGVPVTDFDPYCLKHGEERRELLKLATLEDAGLKRSALLKYFLPKKPSEKRRFTDFAPVGVRLGLARVKHREISLIIHRIRDAPAPGLHGRIEFRRTRAEIIS